MRLHYHWQLSWTPRLLFAGGAELHEKALPLAYSILCVIDAPVETAGTCTRPNFACTTQAQA